MRFLSRPDVKKLFEGKAVAIVGSGPGVLDNAPHYIDAHDIVVRVNNYTLCEQAGFRTDVFYSFFGHSIGVRAEQAKRDGVYLCMCKCPDAHAIESIWHERRGKTTGVDFRYIYEARKDWWFCDIYVPEVPEFIEKFELLNRHIPTTGFSAILDILSFDPKSVYLTGFDFYRSGLHNVDRPWRLNNPRDPIGHVPEDELAWLARNAHRYPIRTDRRLREAMASCTNTRESSTPIISSGEMRAST